MTGKMDPNAFSGTTEQYWEDANIIHSDCKKLIKKQRKKTTSRIIAHRVKSVSIYAQKCHQSSDKGKRPRVTMRQPIFDSSSSDSSADEQETRPGTAKQKIIDDRRHNPQSRTNCDHIESEQDEYGQDATASAAETSESSDDQRPRRKRRRWENFRRQKL